jgi:asparagine synthase (glutamine-hydrolysing)
MCGLVGYLSNQNIPVAPDVLLSRMADCIAHRGPDDFGVWHDSKAGIVLAHHRLSVVDLSSAGHQPMHAARGRYVMVFNGEIYNHSKLRSELEASNHSLNWNGNSDTEGVYEYAPTLSY